MNTDESKELFDKEINAANEDLSEIDSNEVTNPIVQTSEALREVIQAEHQPLGSPPVSEQMEKLEKMVAPFPDDSEKILDCLADERIEEIFAALTLRNLDGNVSGSEISIDNYKINALQDRAKELTETQRSAVFGLLLAVDSDNSLAHSSALYTSCAGGDPQEMARQCQQECRDANNLSKTICASMDNTDDKDLNDAYDTIQQVLEEIYKRSPQAKQHAEQLAKQSERFKMTADSTLQFTACAHLNVLNARQFIDDLKGKIEDDDLEDLTAIFAEADKAFNQLLDDISPKLYDMLFTNCLAKKLPKQNRYDLKTDTR